MSIVADFSAVAGAIWVWLYVDKSDIISSMNILYVLPWDTTYKYKTAFVPSLSYQPMTLSVLAGMTPDSLNADITLVDEGVMRFDYEKNHYDVVGITVCTSSSKRGYDLAEFFRARGSYVLIGGHHATLLPEEVAQYADTVFAGAAEVTFPAFWADYIAGTPKAIYRAEGPVQADKLPIPRRDLMPSKGYLKQPTIVADYGCSNACKYCVIHSFWGNCARRSIDRVVDEIKQTGAKEYLFLDPSPLSNRSYAKELFEAMIPLKIKWAGLATLDIAEDAELLALMEKSGCIGTLLGFETFNQDDLGSMSKYKNKVQQYRQITDAVHEHGMAILGAFMLGLDGDTKESIRNLPDMIEQTKIDIPRYAILTPYPNTPLFEQLDAEGRILHRVWSKYDSVHCVFKPQNMTAPELEAEFLKVWRDTYKYGKIFRRLGHTPQWKVTALVTNIGFKIYAGRLRGIV